MTAKELAMLLGMDSENLTASEKIQLDIYIEAGVEYINNFFEKYGVDKRVNSHDLPPVFKIAIKQYAEASQLNSTVESESIGGMSAKYRTGNGNGSGNNANIFGSLDEYLKSFISNKIRFKPFKG